MSSICENDSDQNQVVGVCRDKFYEELHKLYSEKQCKKPWSMDHYDDVIKLIRSGQQKQQDKENRENKEFYYMNKYDLMEIRGATKIILKQEGDDIVYVVPIEEFYEKINEAHKATGHGGRDKVLHFLKKKTNIPRIAIEIFLKLCNICTSKTCQTRKGVVVRPITSKDFNSRGQIDLIDLQSAPDGQYKWLMNYQDHLSKFIHLRPLHTKRAAEVALELCKIFLIQGAPSILQSDNGKEFTAAIIEELVQLWPECKIIHGRPRHPQSQGSVKRANQDVEQMLRSWMKENGSTRWSIGCYYVQWQKNTSYHRVIGRSPYKAVYGTEPKVGLSSSNLPAEILKNIHSEEQLDIEYMDLRQTQNSPELNQNYVPQDEVLLLTTSDVESVSSPMTFNTNEENESTNDVDSMIMLCCVCKKESTGAHSCMTCGQVTHLICAIPENDDQENEGFGSKVLCHLCVQENSVIKQRADSYEGQVTAAKKMKLCSEDKFQKLPVGSPVVATVPKVDRGPLDDRNIGAFIIDERHGVYQLGTKGEIIKNWFSRNEIEAVEDINLDKDDISNKTISVREAVAQQSSFSGQGFSKCHCKESKTQCGNKRCACFKNGSLCSSKCHSSLTCQNK